ncbi:MAG TPA: hypothetical protein VFS08_11065 [Gemmatimonadaceae bacterium]|nr:hypothetical protein [Gemmatimonadaceae bacterium]
MRRRLPSVAVLAAAALVAAPLFALPTAAHAQRVIVHRGRAPSRTAQPRRSYFERSPARQLSLSVGVLRYDPADDDNFPMAALRVDWRLRHWLRSEVGLAYALADVTPAGAPAGSDEEINSSLLAATVGVQAELPVPYVRPYVGAAAGLFGRLDEEGGDRFVRPTMAFPVGIRIPLSSRLGLRAEARWRFDEHETGGSAVDVEQTVGVSFGW